MTLFHPTLKINRLVAHWKGQVVYDEKFHYGLNILSGRNGGGKTSVIQLLMYGLGYEIRNWRVEANSCDSIFVEIETNGHPPLTLRRLHSEKEKQPIDICFKAYDQAILTSINEWNNYPYSINSSRESFSQKIFSILGLPEARADENNNITLHQIFRLLYSDQSNPASCIFNIEQFDSAFKREAIGRYLLGLYDNSLYEKKIELSKKEKELDRVIAKIQAVYTVIGKTSYPKELNSIEQQKISLNNKIKLSEEKVLKLKEIESLQYSKEKEVTENFAQENIKKKIELLECEEEIQALTYEINDSTEFITELRDKLNSIIESIRTEKAFTSIKFDICPACLSNINDHGDSCCDLCGTDNVKQTREVNILRMKNEIEIQIRESTRLLEQRKLRIDELQKKRKEYRSALQKNIRSSSINLQSVNSAAEKEYYTLYKQIGEYEERIVNLEKIGELHAALEQLSKERNELQGEVNDLKTAISTYQSTSSSRETEVNQTIAKHLLYLISTDTGTEETFKAATEVEYDFAANRISVNNKTSFAESTAVYLNNALHLAFLFTSLEKNYIRIPRLMILDGIENGGMEDARSQNFQMVIAKNIGTLEAKGQIIIATKSIHPDLNTPNYVIGATYTQQNKSLKFK
ncbi:AAA family ATPase [Aquitalea aquatilis]|uniref:AAA family ATPase n=1 Tax=Aquitalea aquatilis TaxID=1537400 RepID=UPI0010BD0379|nr:AAA family ATPase [Aquitalea aquatilis]